MHKSRYLSTFILLGIIFIFSPASSSAALTELISEVPVEYPFHVYLPLIRKAPVLVTSFDFIEDALERGEIDAETALIYKVFASFGDNRLPLKYRGNDSQVRETHIIREAQSQYDGLSTQAKITLDPFLLPPYVPGSWVYLDTALDNSASGNQSRQKPEVTIEWGTISNPGSKVKVWYEKRYPGDNLKAQRIADAIDNTIWPKLVGLMGREPMGDGNVNVDNGGDARLDIYLVHLSVDYGKEKTYIKTLDATPAYILINTLKPDAYLLPTAAHEFMHALTDAYSWKGGNWAWFSEASATWAEDYVYPTGSPGYPNFHSEHEYAPAFLDYPKESLDTFDESHEYGAYLFPFFLARKLWGPWVLPKIWEKAETMDSLSAINSEVFFDLTWHQFALYNFNFPPVHDYYQLDNLSASAKTVDTEISLAGAQKQTFPLDANIPYLSASYRNFIFQDGDIRTVMVGPGVNAGGSTSYALQYIAATKNSGWVLGLPSASLCFEDSGDQLNQMIAIFSNSHISQPTVFSRAPFVSVTNIHCWSWSGTLDVILEEKNPSVNKNIYETVHLEVTFEQSAKYQREIDFSLVSGTAQWNHVGTDGDCSGSGSGTFTIGPGQGVMWISLDPYLDLGNYDVSLDFVQRPAISYFCTGGGGSIRYLYNLGWWTPPEGWFVSSNGASMLGSRTVVQVSVDGTETTTQYQLNLTAKPKTP